jgi:cellulose biosynthesis protein BcsQ
VRTIAFFNNKGGVGKTSLCYHLAWMFSELGVRVVAVDLDPQANLSSMFLDEDRLEELWPDGAHEETVYACVAPIAKGLGDIQTPHIEEINPRLGLVVGDLELSRFEARLSSAWNDCMNRDEAAFRVSSSFHRIVQEAGRQQSAEIGLIDVGPNLGASNRSSLLAADYVVIPLAADLFSLQGLKNLGPTLADWRQEWKDRRERKPPPMQIDLPRGRMEPLGYVVLQHATRLDRPVKAYKRWMDRIPEVYRQEVLQEGRRGTEIVANDPNCLASLKNYRSLMPYAQDVRKPIFLLKPADGALGGHMTAVQDCYKDFKRLAKEIARRSDVEIE